ncbi:MULTISPECIES: phosphatase PAP2 family protein [unclassified Streptomyces]|uniref:phosphatase PAP2 family protein n=1 Tax=unclassified Streptomyces TaxID=2593676 RepID=UPI004042C4E4
MRSRSPARPARAAALCAWAAFGVLAAVVAHAHGPLPPDRGLLSWSVAHRPPVAVAVARGLTDTGTGVVPYLLVVLAGLVAGRTVRQRLVAVLLGVLCLAAGQVLRYGVMELIARARPPQYDWQTEASGWSFPSGHTTTSALAAGLLITALCVRAPRGRAVLCPLVACWGAGVGLTRVFLGVHWFTDVLGGWLFAAGWLGVLVLAAARWLPATHPDDASGGPAATDAPRDPRRRGWSPPA